MLEILTGKFGLALLGFVPESLAVFIFGGALILLAVGLRKFFGKNEAVGKRRELENTIG